MPYYLSFQYSAIQKTILRHHRLWWMAGTSLTLSRLNEIDLPDIAGKNRGKVLVAGGGKFTVKFEAQQDAQQCLEETKKLVATTLPMLEFQACLGEGDNLKQAWEKGKNDSPGLREQIQSQKAGFRGYGLTFNPHLQRCDECGEYPAVAGKGISQGEKKPEICSLCYEMGSASRIDKNSLTGNMTTLEKIYSRYFEKKQEHLPAEIPANFEDLFQKSDNEDKGRKRMAVWASDINNMNDKVPVWLAQDEDKIKETFDEVKQIFIDSTVNALINTGFSPVSRDNGKKYLPFRIIVAGGDDLCLVMDEKYVLDFATNLSKAVNEALAGLADDHPLNISWIEARKSDIRKRDPQRMIKPTEPYGFGASFVVTPVHSPFSRLHALGELLMNEAKEKTGRKANSVNWRIIGDEADVSSELLKFEKPVFIEPGSERPADWSGLDLSDYQALCARHKLSNSQVQQLAAWLFAYSGQPDALEKQIIKRASSEHDKNYSCLLLEEKFREKSADNGPGKLIPARLATFLELMSLPGSKRNE
ncbi:hypothetical protein [Desulfonatronovibrio hydrogenovorans]|uniref:hypothetical protein n=1 Tax=Desulfonatronovibrio hydrogenovorans TaxID=53245 RepID=UPI000490472A|nr:hypothetical protein [Desulfonatronovibrio hydrogenovorans]